MWEEGTESANVALVQRVLGAFDRRDLSALIELTDPEVELFAPTAALANEGRCYRGHDGIARYLLDVERLWLRLEIHPEKFREVGNHVVTVGRVRAEARDGMKVDAPVAWVWQARGSRLVWGCVYADPGETFMGVPLSQEPAQPSAAKRPSEPGGPAPVPLGDRPHGGEGTPAAGPPSPRAAHAA
jgi:ketosteroid isomerase-like protein